MKKEVERQAQLQKDIHLLQVKRTTTVTTTKTLTQKENKKLPV